MQNQNVCWKTSRPSFNEPPTEAEQVVIAPSLGASSEIFSAAAGPTAALLVDSTRHHEPGSKREASASPYKGPSQPSGTSETDAVCANENSFQISNQEFTLGWYSICANGVSYSVGGSRLLEDCLFSGLYEEASFKCCQIKTRSIFFVTVCIYFDKNNLNFWTNTRQNESIFFKTIWLSLKLNLLVAEGRSNVSLCEIMPAKLN